ncbi:MAG: FtsX-like permease family protein [Deltaproteobacteria bacterium]|nr:FtsX-like permease family protein [Deltaproteobacteria bacterium]
MRALDRKLLRDLVRLKMQVAAIALVVASGVALFVAMLSTYRSLRVSSDIYYRQQRFAHVWADLSRAPRAVTREVAAIPGVAAVEGRIKQQAILDVPGLAEPASAQIVSIPKTAGHSVNDLHVRRGRHVEAGHPGEVLVSEAFAETNHLALGDTMTAVIGGQRVKLRFVGVALSPEYVMPVPPSGLAPDDRRFAILWMAHDELESLLDLRGAINEVAVTLTRGADERAVTTDVDRVLSPYGGRGAYGRQSQASHTMLEEHIRSLRSPAVLLPSIFLIVAAFLVNIVLSRIVATQREQIGLLKAFGYDSRTVGRHYLELTLLMVLPGIVLGIPLGGWLGTVFADFFARFFRFPVLVFAVEPAIVLLAALAALFFAALGALGTVRRVLAIPPIVAMAPELPTFHRSFLDVVGLSRLVRVLAPTSRMVLRGVTRHRLRTVFAVAGMSLAVAVTMIGVSISDAFERMRDVHYQVAAREDMTVSLAHPRALSTIHEFAGLPGVRRAEPLRVVPARLLARGTVRDVTLLGLPEGGVLRHAADNAFGVAAIPREGAILTKPVAEELGLRRGDLLRLEIREQERRTVTTRLVDVIDEPLGAAVYMDLRALGRLIGEPETYSAVSLLKDPARDRELYAVLKRTPSAAAVDFRAGSLLAYRAMSDTAVEFVRKVDVLFAVIIAFGVVYNTAKVALAERARELATLRVLGFTRGEVSRILLGEIAVLASLAVPIGLALGWWLSGILAAGTSGQRMHVPHVVELATYGFSIAVFFIATIASALIVRRGVDRLDLIGALKARE